MLEGGAPSGCEALRPARRSMNPWWNLLFAGLVLLGLWCRLGAPRLLIALLSELLDFFGIEARGEVGAAQASADVMGIAGVSGLVFAGWADRLAEPGVWLTIDVVATSIGLGLLGAWILSRLGQRRADRAETARISRDMSLRAMTMIEVDEVPEPRPRVAEGGTSDPA